MKTTQRIAATLLTITVLASCASDSGDENENDPTEENVTTDTDDGAEEPED